VIQTFASLQENEEELSMKVLFAAAAPFLFVLVTTG
jgi:hypothetical protein